MFTLIAYRSNGYCSSGSQTNSELDISYHETVDSLGVEFLKFKRKEFDHRDYREFDNYEFTILHNGRDLYDVNHDFHNEVFAELHAIANADMAKWKQEEEDELAQKRLRERNAQRERDFAELARIHERLAITG